jgi:hypothetical protein
MRGWPGVLERLAHEERWPVIRKGSKMSVTVNHFALTHLRLSHRPAPSQDFQVAWGGLRLNFTSRLKTGLVVKYRTPTSHAKDGSHLLLHPVRG